MCCQETRDVMTRHLNFFKWKESALSTEQLKSSRWLLNAGRKNVAEAVKPYLVMTPRSQEMLMTLHVRQFEKAGRRLNASARSRLRLSATEFEKLADYAAMMESVRVQAKLVNSKPEIEGPSLLV